MKTTIQDNFFKIIDNIQRINSDIELVAISKFQPVEKILPLIECGHRVFGESRIEEAIDKWASLKDVYSDLELHFIGGIQSKKIKKIVNFFDVIDSVDSIDNLIKIARHVDEINKQMKIFIQVNIGNESQKSGIHLDELDDLYNEVMKYENIALEGFMCIPPNVSNPELFFLKMKELKSIYNVKKLSMGMSNDYEIAIQSGSDCIRIGSSLFGSRDKDYSEKKLIKD